MRKKLAKMVEMSVKVSVPVPRFSQNYPKDNIEEAEEYFRQMTMTYSLYKDREAESDSDRCRLLLKWAKTCEAKLKNLEPALSTQTGPSLNFTFAFTDMEMFATFVKSLDINVNGISGSNRFCF